MTKHVKNNSNDFTSQVVQKGRTVLGSINRFINDIFQPGIYGIVNKLTNKTYIGQSKSLLSRIVRHYVELTLNVFKLSNNLQTDWKNLKGLTNFEFVILEMGPEWSDYKVRLNKEAAYIYEYSDNVYNSSMAALFEKIKQSEQKPIYAEAIYSPDSPVKTKRVSRPVAYKHLFFRSLLQAAKHFYIQTRDVNDLINNEYITE